MDLVSFRSVYKFLNCFVRSVSSSVTRERRPFFPLFCEDLRLCTWNSWHTGSTCPRWFLCFLLRPLPAARLPSLCWRLGCPLEGSHPVPFVHLGVYLLISFFLPLHTPLLPQLSPSPHGILPVVFQLPEFNSTLNSRKSVLINPTQPNYHFMFHFLKGQ